MFSGSDWPGDWSRLRLPEIAPSGILLSLDTLKTAMACSLAFDCVTVLVMPALGDPRSIDRSFIFCALSCATTDIDSSSRSVLAIDGRRTQTTFFATGGDICCLADIGLTCATGLCGWSASLSEWPTAAPSSAIV